MQKTETINADFPKHKSYVYLHCTNNTIIWAVHIEIGPTYFIGPGHISCSTQHWLKLCVSPASLNNQKALLFVSIRVSIIMFKMMNVIINCIIALCKQNDGTFSLRFRLLNFCFIRSNQISLAESAILCDRKRHYKFKQNMLSRKYLAAGFR